jgi:NAD(P)-dependent dehydrogenase (short-subunit alcohol dehydrogenase family)
MLSELGSTKVAVVTGASEGIGKAISQAMLSAGFRVVLVSRNEAKLVQVLDAVDDPAQNAWIYPADMTDPSQVNQMVSAVIDREKKIDVIVNNLGQGLRREIIETSDEEWKHLVEINLSSSFYGSRAVLPHMRVQRSGSIINISSRSGRKGEGPFAAYSAMKHGLIGLTRALAESEDPYGIKVNAICPGPVATEKMLERYPDLDHSKWTLPENVAQTVLFVLSPASSTMNGRCIDLFM